MKLRPTKDDLKTLDKLKKATGQATYTKALMESARYFSIHQKMIEKAQKEAHDLRLELEEINYHLEQHHESVQFFTARAAPKRK